MFLADTNVVSELFRASADRRVTAWAELQPRLAVSAVTVEELAFGFARRPNPELEARVGVFLDENCEIVAVDQGIARRSGRLRGRLEAAGQTRHSFDMLIAATAAERGFTLATRNVRDFAGCGIRVINPFTRR